MIKLSIAIADTKALPSAFVVFRGFEKCIPKAATLGFDGVELALKRAEEIDIELLHQLLGDNNLEVSCISTGQVFADGGLTLTDENPQKRSQVIAVFKDLIDLAAIFGKKINMGRVRGTIGNRSQQWVENLFCETLAELGEYAGKQKVTLLIEPINRYESDFINTIQEGIRILKKTGLSNLKIMPDVFHMNIEEVSIIGELAENIQYIDYIHLADSNRKAPGQGHIDFKKIFNTLAQSGFKGWTSVEILDKPNADEAARQAADYLHPLIKAYNKTLLMTNA